MRVNANRVVEGKDFNIFGASYIGKPKSNTALYISKKIEKLLSALTDVKECLVFAEEGMDVPEPLLLKHAFHFSVNPQLSYSVFAAMFERERNEEESKLRYNLTPEGYYISETAVVGKGAYIEPNCVIGHGVTIGENATILSGTVIRHATIGDNFIANEQSVIGSSGFTMAEDEDGNKIRIPTLGHVIIGDNVEVGAHDNISCGSGGDTVLEDFVKLDALVHIGHDTHLHKNVEITAGVTISGFCELGEHAYVGVNAVLRNRIKVGENAFIGMGSNVTKSVEANTTVAGNPAKIFLKNKAIQNGNL